MHAGTHAVTIVCYPRSPHIYWIHINEALLLCVQATIIISDFFLRLQNNGGGRSEYEWKTLGTALMFWLENERGDWQADHMHAARLWCGFKQLCLFFPPSFSLSRCHVCTNKSAYLRADTKVTELDLSPGVHQHIGWLDICRDKLPDRTATQALRSHYLSTPTHRQHTSLLTSMKYF